MRQRTNGSQACVQGKSEYAAAETTFGFPETLDMAEDRLPPGCELVGALRYLERNVLKARDGAENEPSALALLGHGAAYLAHRVAERPRFLEDRGE